MQRRENIAVLSPQFSNTWISGGVTGKEGSRDSIVVSG
jgi:hypothetical protein